MQWSSRTARFHSQSKHRPPPPSPTPPHRKGSGSSEESNSSSSSSSPPSTSTVTVVNGNESIIQSWLWDLQPCEKKDVLTVSLPDLLRELHYGGVDTSHPALRRRVENLLSNADHVTAIRRAFVDGLHSEGKMEVSPLLRFVNPTHSMSSAVQGLDEVTSVVIAVMEAQLSVAHQRKQSLISLTTLSVFYFFAVSTLSPLLRYPVIAVLLAPSLYVATARTAGPLHAFDPHPRTRRWQLRLSWLVLPFESDGPKSLTAPALQIRVEAFCAGLLLSAWGALQFSLTYYWVVVGLCSLTLVLLECHLALIGRNERLLWYLSAVCRYLSEVQVLWLSWDSWWSFGFCCLFFFPAASTVILSTACVACGTILLPALLLIQSRIIPNASQLLLSLLYALSLLYLWLYWSTLSYFFILPVLLLTFLLTPSFLSSSLAVAATTAAQLLLTLGCVKLFLLAAQLIALLIVTGVILGGGWAWPRVTARWENSGWGRGWKESGEVGRWRWKMEEWLRPSILWMAQRWRTSVWIQRLLTFIDGDDGEESSSSSAK